MLADGVHWRPPANVMSLNAHCEQPTVLRVTVYVCAASQDPMAALGQVVKERVVSVFRVDTKSGPVDGTRGCFTIVSNGACIVAKTNSAAVSVRGTFEFWS